MCLLHHMIELCTWWNLIYLILNLSPHCHHDKPTRHRPSSPHRHLSFIAGDIFISWFFTLLHISKLLLVSVLPKSLDLHNGGASILIADHNFMSTEAWNRHEEEKITGEHRRDLQQCTAILTYSIILIRVSIFNCFLLDLKAKSIWVLWITTFYWIHR